MTPGQRTHKKASLRVAVAECLPVEMWEKTRELVDVISENQQRGEAAALIRSVCNEADKANLVLILQPIPFSEGLTVDKLKMFYSKFGFAEIQADPCLMSRVPQ